MRGKWWGAAAVLAAWVAIPGVSSAQYLTFDAARRGEVISLVRPSLRLAAMGDLFLVIPDENNELNLSDFGDNLAGIATDRRGWSVESWAGRSNSYHDSNTIFHGSGVAQRNRFDLERAGMDAVYRRDGKRALGLSTVWQGYDARVTYGPNSRVSGPLTSAFASQSFGRLTAAAGLGFASDNEDVVSADIFSIRHSSKTRRLSFAAGWDLGHGGMALGAQLDADQVRIDGSSADPAGFHADSYDWRRPTTTVRLSLVRPEGSQPLAFGINLGRLVRDGTEDATISWSDRFPSNPARVNYLTRVPTFTEKERSWDAEGRASWRAMPRLRVSGGASYQKLTSDVHEAENANFVGSRRQENATLTSWQLDAGIGTVLRGGRLRAGLEGSVAGGKLDSTRPRVSLVDKTRGYEARTGLEYLATPEFAVRAGLQRRSQDYAVGEPASLGVSNGYTVGFGYLPQGGLVAIDTYIRFWKETPDVVGDANRGREARDVAISARLLF